MIIGGTVATDTSLVLTDKNSAVVTACNDFKEATK